MGVESFVHPITAGTGIPSELHCRTVVLPGLSVTAVMVQLGGAINGGIINSNFSSFEVNSGRTYAESRSHEVNVYKANIKTE